MFFEEVELDGKKVPRFKYVDEIMPEKLAEKYQSMTEWGRPAN